MGLGEIRLGEMGLGEMGLGEMGQNRWNWGGDMSTKKPAISPKRCKIGPKLRRRTNRKSHARCTLSIDTKIKWFRSIRLVILSEFVFHIKVVSPAEAQCKQRS